MKFSVDQGRCQGHAQCSLIAPAVFLLDDDGYIDMNGDYEYADADAAAVTMAVQSCPEEVLQILR